jgi:tetratricopeptide (TPR) repeat protein
MYTLLLSIGLTTLISTVPMFFGIDAWTTILPGFFVGIIVFVLVGRRISKRVEAVTRAADAEMTKAQSVAQRSGTQAQAVMMRAIDTAVTRLHSGMVFRKWQLGVTTMLNARIGMLLYTKSLLLQQGGKKAAVRGALKEAIPYLEASRVKGRKARLLQALWPAWAMLAVAHYRTEKGIDGAIEVFEATVKVAPKAGLLWSMYAWLLWKSKRLDEAVDVLARAKDKADSDKRLDENLSLLQNRKPMKMRAYGEQWYQFGLEQPRAAQAQPQMGHPRMRGGRRR